MRTSEETIEIFQAIHAAQADIGAAVKDASNPFFKSTYADLNAVIREIKPILSKHGIAYLQHPVSDQNGVGVCTRFTHITGQWIEESFTLPLSKPDPQAAGAAVTYARRYALKSMVGMPDVDDDAESAMFRVTEAYTEEQRETLIALLADGNGMGLRKFYQEVGQETMDALFNSAPQGEKTKFKNKVRALYGEANTTIKAYLEGLQEAIDKDDGSQAQELVEELDEVERGFVMAGMDEVMLAQIEALTGVNWR